jgi:hypothetical protein
MHRLKSMALAATLVLLTGAFVSSQAQRKLAPVKIMPPVPVVGNLNGSYVSRVTAMELSQGEMNPVANTVYGWTSYGQSKGDLSGFFFISMNYQLPFNAPDDPIGVVGPVLKMPVPYPVSGGSWTKLIFVDGLYMGSVSGQITSGTIAWDASGQTAAIELKLTSSNGTEAYSGAVGTGEFSGTLDRTAEGGPAVDGLLTLSF